MKMGKGMFIVLEGGEHFGKSFQSKGIEKYFLGKQIPFISVREPGQTEPGKIIRNILQERGDFDLHPLTELFLYSADRVETFHKIIKPSLNKGISILEDRSWPSTKIYQGKLGGLDLEYKGLIDYINKITTFGVLPDKLFILTGNQRELIKKIDNKDRMEEKVSKNPELIDKGYLEIAKNYPDISILIPYQKGNPKAMQQEIRNHLEKFSLLNI